MKFRSEILNPVLSAAVHFTANRYLVNIRCGTALYILQHRCEGEGAMLAQLCASVRNSERSEVVRTPVTAYVTTTEVPWLMSDDSSTPIMHNSSSSLAVSCGLRPVCDPVSCELH